MMEPKYDKVTAEAMKAALEAKLTAGEKWDSQQMQTDAAAYLEIERGIFRVDHPVDANCKNIPPWERKPNQIIRDVDDIEYFTADETGLARRFVAEAKDWLGWDNKMKRWLYWAGNHWEEDDADLFSDRLTELIRDSLYYEKPEFMYLVLKKQNGKPSIDIEINPAFIAIQSSASRIRTRQLIVNAARAGLSAKFDSRPEIPFANGLFNLETCELIHHAPENYNTTAGPTNLILNPPAFEPGQKFIEEISCNDPSWVTALFRIIGECLLYGNPHQIFIVCYGCGQNGKGVLFDWLEKTLGNLIGICSPNEISKVNKDGRQTTLAKHVGSSRILLFKETGGIQYNDELIKALTGERRIPLLGIYSGMKEYDICGTPILITNTLPTTENGGVSMMRRQIGIPFDLQLSSDQIDETLLNRLATPEGNEWLLARIVDELIDSHKPNAAKFKESLPSRITKFTTDLINEADIVLQFLNECCTRTGIDAIRTPRSDLYQAFCGFAYSPDGRSPQSSAKFRMSQKTFGDRLRAHNLTPMEGQQRTNDGRVRRHVYPGIALNQTGDEYFIIGECWKA